MTPTPDTWQDRVNQSGRHMDLLGGLGLDHIPVKQTAEACVCGKPVQPGQLYLPGPPVRHLGCRGRAG